VRRLIGEQHAWWKKVFEAKYLSNLRQQLLDNEIPTSNSSKTWKLCKRVIPFMVQNISKLPKGGGSVKIGADRIMGNQSISSQPGMDQILLFFHNKGIHYLDQISQCDINSFSYFMSVMRPNCLLWLREMMKDSAIKMNR